MRRFLKDSYFIDKGAGNVFQLNNNYWTLKNIEGLDSEFMNNETMQTIEKWSQVINTIDISERQIAIILHVNNYHDAAEYIERNFVPGDKMALCYAVTYTYDDASKPDKQVVISMPLTMSSATWNKWNGDAQITMNFTADLPFFSASYTYDTEILGTSITTGNGELGTIPSPFSISADIVRIEKNTQYAFRIRKFLPNKQTFFATIPFMTPSDISETGRIIFHSDDIMQTEICDKRLLTMANWSGTSVIVPDEPALIKNGISYELQITKSDTSAQNPISFNNVHQEFHPRYVSVPTPDELINYDAWDSALIPMNIRKGVTIGGVVGNYGGGGELPDYGGRTDIIPTTAVQTLQTKDKSVRSDITVAAVTASIDKDIKPENIRKGVNILGIDGALESSRLPNYEGPYSIIPQAQKTALQTLDKSMTDNLTIEAVTAAVDPAIKPENIKKGTTILGVAGTYEGGAINTPAPRITGIEQYSDVGGNGNISEFIRYTGSGSDTVLFDVFTPESYRKFSTLTIQAPYGADIEIKLRALFAGDHDIPGGTVRGSFFNIKGYRTEGGSDNLPIIRFDTAFSEYALMRSELGESGYTGRLDYGIFGQEGAFNANFENVRFAPPRKKSDDDVPQIQIRCTHTFDTFVSEKAGVFVGGIKYSEYLWQGVSSNNFLVSLIKHLVNPGYHWILYLYYDDVPSKPLFDWTREQKIEFVTELDTRYNCEVQTNLTL